MTDVAIFDAKGVFIPLTDEVIATFGAAQADAYMAVANADAVLRVADKAVADAQDHVRSCVANVRDAEKYLADNFVAPTYHDLWKENFARK